MFDPAIGVIPSTGVRGLVLLSARLRADIHPDNPNAKNVGAYFGEDSSLLEERSPISYAHRCQTPLFVGVAQFENRLLDQYGLEFALGVARGAGRMPRVVQCWHHNHTSIVAHFGSPDEKLGNEILDFIQSECFPLDH
jgi:acetyl esterase